MNVQQVKVKELKPSAYNPRTWSNDAISQLKASITEFGLVDPIIVNGDNARRNIVIGGHFRLHVAKQLGFTEVPVVYLDIPDIDREKELNLRLNKAIGDWDWNLLAEFDDKLLADVGFTSEELDTIFEIDTDEPGTFDLEKELKKLDITSIEAKAGDVYKLGDSRLMVGDSTVATDMQQLMDGEQADMCFTDPPYRLNYMYGGIRHGKPTEETGSKRNRRYLETEEIPEDFTTLWMQNVADAAKPDFSIIVYEAWQNLREIWSEME